MVIKLFFLVNHSFLCNLVKILSLIENSSNNQEKIDVIDNTTVPVAMGTFFI